ncbi:hypothetical protein DFH28DRAFT_890201 [Melampsora americana]|nr:hypothetical protein DFH28DRAFT_890201 [Melampsora americana]
MMLNRSRGTSNASSGGSSDPTPDPRRPAISSDLDQFNFETSDANDLQLQVQINNALQEQAALAGTATASQADTGPPHSNSGPTPTHLTGTRLALFNPLAARSRLDKQSLSLGRFLCNVKGRDDQFLSCVVGILVVQQEVDSVRMELLEAIKQITSARPGVSPDGATWKADSAELKQTIRLLATQCILGGDVQAYTGRVDPDGGTDQLPLCLYGKTMSAMLSNPSEWKNRILPPGYGTNPDPRHTLHVGSHANVPMLDTVIVKLYQKERGLIGGRVHVREEILQDVDQLRTSRYAWLLNFFVYIAQQRMQAMHWGLNFAEYEGRSFWNVVDRQLAYLRSQSTRYRYAFFLLVLQFDLERIDGTKTFEELKETTDFSLPTETQIQDTIDELNVTFGDEVQPEEEAYQSLSEEET